MKKLILVILVILSFGNSQTVTLDPITPQNYCTGDAYTISFQVSGGAFNPGNIFTLELSDNSGNFASPTILGTLNITGSGTFNHVWGVFPYGIGYRVRVTASDPSFTSLPSSSLTLSPVLNGNTIGSQQTVCAGNGITLTGSLPSGGSGTYVYQWESSSDDVVWSNISGQTNQNMSSITPSVTSYFRRKAESGNSVCAALYSSSIRVDVLSIISNNTILSDETICAGITISGITGSTPTGGTGSYSYQWQSSSNLISWQTIPGFAAQDFNYNFGLSATTYFRRSVSDGFCNSNSGHIQITVIPGIGNNIIGNNQTLCIGNPSGSITGSLPTGGNDFNTYQWQSSNDNSGWFDISGATIISYAPGLVGSTTYFRRGVTAGLCNAFTNTVTILIVPVLTNNLVGSNQTICSGGSPALFTGTLPNGGNNQFIYQWETSTNNIGWTVLSGSTNQNLSYLQSMSSSLYFRRIVTNPFCSFSTSSSVFVSVIPIITNNTVGSNQTLCQGSAASLTGTLPLGGTGIYMYQWFSGSDNINWSPIANATSSQLNTGALNSSVFFYRLINSGPCQSNSGSVRITIHVPITANTIGSNQTVCANQLFSNLTGSAPLGGSGIYSYQWFSSSDDISWNSISSGTQNGFTSVSLNGTRYFRRVVSSLPCPAVTSSSIRITVNPIPSAAVTVSGPLNFCTGDSVIMSAPGSLNYLWSTGSVMQSIMVRNSGSYTVQVTNSFNCTVLSSVLPVIVYALPTPVISGVNTLCSGNVTTLSTGIYSNYLWNTGHSSPTLAVNAPGTYMVRVTDINNCVASSPSFLVTVFQTPISAIVPSGATVFCEGNLLVLSGSTGVSNSWNTGSMTDTIQVFRSGYYIDTITSPEGCRSWSGINILVNPNPRPRISYSTSLEFCDGDSVRLKLPSQYASYLWSGGSGNSDISVTQSGTYSVLVLDQNGCYGYSDTVTTVKKNIPVVTIFPSGSFNVCRGNSALLQGGGATQYVWSNGVLGSILNVSTSGTYSVTGTSNGCSGSSQAVTVSVIEPPQPNFIADGPLRFCQGDSVILSAISPAPYLWSNGSTQSSICIKSTGSYSLTTNLAGCSNNSGSIQVLVDTLPFVQIAASDTLFCIGDTIQLQYLSPGLNQVQWSSGQTFPTIQVTQPGAYFLMVWDGNNCASNSDTIQLNNYKVTSPQIVNTGDSVLCPGDSASLTVLHGVHPIWNTGDTSNILWVKSSGVYSVNLQDSFGCRVPSNTISISAVEMPEIRITANGPFQICEGDSVLLNASETDGIFNWSNGDTTSQTTITQTGNYILEYFDPSGKCAVLDSVFIDVKNIPPVEIESASTDIACRGDKLDLSTSSVYESYFWNTGDTTRSISIQTSGVYQVSVSAYGCERQTSLPIMLGFQAPQEALVLKADDINTGILICREEGKQYLWGYEYKENNNGQEFFVCDGDCRPWIKYDYLDTAQFYYWVYVGDNNCLQKWYWNGHGGLREGRFDTQITEWKVYPNPFSSTMFLSIPDNSSPLQVELINNMGKVIQNFPVQSFVEGGKLRMELFDIPAGVYWLSIRHESGREVIEVLRQ